jgi:hypothetical protein
LVHSNCLFHPSKLIAPRPKVTNHVLFGRRGYTTTPDLCQQCHAATCSLQHPTASRPTVLRWDEIIKSACCVLLTCLSLSLWPSRALCNGIWTNKGAAERKTALPPKMVYRDLQHPTVLHHSRLCWDEIIICVLLTYCLSLSLWPSRALCNGIWTNKGAAERKIELPPKISKNGLITIPYSTLSLSLERESAVQFKACVNFVKATISKVNPKLCYFFGTILKANFMRLANHPCLIFKLSHVSVRMASISLFD